MAAPRRRVNEWGKKHYHAISCDHRDQQTFAEGNSNNKLSISNDLIRTELDRSSEFDYSFVTRALEIGESYSNEGTTESIDLTVTTDSRALFSIKAETELYENVPFLRRMRYHLCERVIIRLLME